jgi:DNA-binding response OmpR family regulator
MLSMSRRVVVFNATPNTLTLYWAILTPKHYEVLTYGQDVMTPEEVEALSPSLLVIDHITGLDALELETLHTLQSHPALAARPILVITTALDIVTTYPCLQTMSTATVLVQPFGYQTFLACVEQVLQKHGGWGDPLAE